MSQSRAWITGVVYAAGYVAASHGEDVIAMDLLEAAGITKISQLRELGCDQSDIDNVKPLLPELRRRARRGVVGT